jgi:hypothetical protein
MIVKGWSARHSGVALGTIVTYEVNHLSDAVALGLKATTLPERLGAVLFSVAILLAAMFLAHRLFGRSFFHGFIVASGTILSFDIVLNHWIFQLHRITNGPEADVLEPIFVLFGIGLMWWGIRREKMAMGGRKASGGD